MFSPRLISVCPPTTIGPSPPAAVTLQLKALGVADILAFDFMDRPPQASIERALRVLYDLGCLDDTGACAAQMASQSVNNLHPDK